MSGLTGLLSPPCLGKEGQAGTDTQKDRECVYRNLLLEEGRLNISLKEDDLCFDIILPLKLFNFSQ